MIGGVMDPYFLSDCYLLRGATMGDIDLIRGICEIVEFKAGEPIVTDTDRNQDIMIVASGRARVETREGDLVDELRAGALLGEVAFLDGKGRTANVVAVGDARIVVIPAEGLRGLMKQSPTLEVVILRNAALALCQRLREANQQLGALLVPR
jgi:CRP/FNR family transcriptional regulator, cyclic AMP receptor protein